MKLQKFEAIKITANKANILRRLGFSPLRTKIRKCTAEQIEQYILDALSCLSLTGVAGRLKVVGVTAHGARFSEGIKFKSQKLAVFLESSCEALLMAATAGQVIADEIVRYSSGEDLTRAVIYDAVAGEMADDALSWIMGYWRRQLLREGLVLDTKRFSAGYGDLALSNQKIFWDLLKLKDLNIKITKEFLLVPSKTVTAISGIRMITDSL